MLMVIRVQATVKNVVRKMNNALTTIITNTAAYLPELIGECAAVRHDLLLFRLRIHLVSLNAYSGFMWQLHPIQKFYRLKVR